MKIKILASLLFFSFAFFCCNSKSETPKASFLHSFIESLAIDRSKNILIYTINPNDCINCLKGFVSINDKLPGNSIQKIYVVSIEREIEKSTLMKSVKNIDLNDTINKIVLWDKFLFQKINGSASKKQETSLSLLMIYNYSTDSIIYNKPIKDIIDVEELKMSLERSF